MSSWLGELDRWEGDSNAAVVVAIRAMGERAVPMLVATCLENDGAVKQWISKEFEKHPRWLDYRFTTAPERWGRAHMALRIMGPPARAAIPALVSALTSGSGFVAA